MKATMCDICKFHKTDVAEEPCFSCYVKRGKFELDLEEHDKQIRAEVIDEFAEKIRAYSGEHYIDCDGYGCKPDLVFMTDAFLDYIVEQLKKGE